MLPVSTQSTVEIRLQGKPNFKNFKLLVDGNFAIHILNMVVFLHVQTQIINLGLNYSQLSNAVFKKTILHC